jgi:hypothetical protein
MGKPKKFSGVINMEMYKILFQVAQKLMQYDDRVLGKWSDKLCKTKWFCIIFQLKFHCGAEYEANLKITWNWNCRLRSS